MSAPSEVWRRESLLEVSQGGFLRDGDWVESKDQDPVGTVRLTQLADVGVGEFRNRSDRWMRPEQADRLRCTFLEPADVLIARMPDPIGRACLTPETIGNAVTAVDVAILRIRRADIDPHFVMWAVNSPQFNQSVVARQSGTTRKRISRRNLEALSIPVPPIGEQRRIVEILEEHLSHLDAAERGFESALKRSAIFERQLVMAALVGDGEPGPRSPGPAAAGTDDRDVPFIPADWSWRRLGQVASVVGGVTKDAKKQSDPTIPEVPYLRVANVQRGRLDLGVVTKIRVPAAKASALELHRGDVLLNEGGDRDKLGRGWVWEGQIPGCIHQNHVFRARVKDDVIDPYLLSWIGNYIGGAWCERNGKQSVNLASISLSKIKLMPVPVPPRRAQPGIRSRIETTLEAVHGLRIAVEANRARSAALRRSLLAAAFSGQLTGRASDLERAEEAIA